MKDWKNADKEAQAWADAVAKTHEDLKKYGIKPKEKTQMKDLINQLAGARAAANEEGEWLEKYQSNLEKTPQWDALQQQRAYVAEINAWVAELEAEIKRLALAQFREDGDRHPHPAVEIEIYEAPRATIRKELRDYVA